MIYLSATYARNFLKYKFLHFNVSLHLVIHICAKSDFSKDCKIKCFMFIIILFTMLIHYLDKAKLLCSVMRCSVMCHSQAVKNNYAFIKTVEDACCANKEFFWQHI